MRRKTLWLYGFLAVACLGAQAQVTTLAPSAALACLTPPADERGQPEYPPMRFKSGTAGRVKASAVFSSSDWLPGPSISIDELEGDAAFADSVKVFLRKLRVPCLGRDGKATLVFEFIFNPNSEKTYWLEPIDMADAGRKKLLGCVVHLRGEKAPAYPEAATRAQVQGRVRATMRFVANDRAPEVKLHHRAYAQPLANAVGRWLQDRRMPCFEGEPVNAHATFVFVFEKDVYGFKPLTLVQLLGNVKGIREQRLALDTNTMGCPFDLKLVYLQPDLPNEVGEVGLRDPARRPLLDWLTKVQLDLRSDHLDSVYADTAEIAVPCVKINLNPQEKKQ
jgi:hypothetical protein